MCMLFVWNNSDGKDDEYSLVVVSIRDEQYNRETRVCQQWESNPSVYGGMDMQQGLEGGTWLAINADTNKIGAVLRVMRPLPLSASNHTRGFLVPTFMDSPMTGQQYVGSLLPTARDYPDYVFVAIDIDVVNPSAAITRPAVTVSYFSNAESTLAPTVSTDNDVFAFANNLPSRPWLKTRVGGQRFADITKSYGRVHQRQLLCEKLFELCSDDTEHFPDEVLLADGRGFNNEHLRGLSSINCKIPTAKFGTRTQTIILVDSKGTVEWIERNLSIDNLYERGNTHRDWPLVKFKFRLNAGERRKFQPFPQARF